MAMRKILVALDGSTTAEYVLDYVRQLACATGGQVLLINVQSPLAVWDAEAHDTKILPHDRTANAYLNRKRSQLEQSDLRVHCLAPLGEPAELILRVAEDEQADLVAMTTHGRSGLRRWVLGSVADKVLHAVTLPLLLVRPSNDWLPGAPVPRILKIVVPLDGSELSKAALPVAGSLAISLDASLVLAHVVSSSWTLASGVDAPGLYHQALEEMRAAASKLLEHAAAELVERGFRVECIVGTGSPADEINRIAKNEGAGLIITSTHGRSGVGRFVLGSVADALVRRTALPCLLVRPEHVRLWSHEPAVEAGAVA